MIQRLLIANRGEIACRIIRTARAMGIHTIAVHSELDRSAPHVYDADEAVLIESYLDIDAVVGAARATQADAIHPGYGFLSERSAFARALEDAGIVLVGPSADVMEQMGRKDHAREVAVAAGVAVVPSYDLDADPGGFDYPVLVKAAAGGGGKGMRIVRSEGEYAEAVSAARREASSAFGDDTMIIEKYVESGRHIEVQVLADRHGNVVHLFERDCSTQRRHQKVLEEAPAPTITAEQRAEITSAAVALATEVGYENAGTVEFLLDTASGQAYFLEMNTRLQVEHPVTELVTGLDLVELQLQVARARSSRSPRTTCASRPRDRGARLRRGLVPRVPPPGRHGDDRPLAHPGRGAGVSKRSKGRPRPGERPGRLHVVRPDAGQGDRPRTRPRDRRRALVAALDDTAVLGFTTNVGFLRVLAASDEFRDATIDTAWLDHADYRRRTPTWPARSPRGCRRCWRRSTVRPGRSTRTASGWAPHRLPPASSSIAWSWSTALAGWSTTSRSRSSRQRCTSSVSEVAGRRVQAVVNATTHSVEVVVHGQRFLFERPDPFAGATAVVGEGILTAPMPGTVLAVDVARGMLSRRGSGSAYWRR